MKKKKTIKKVDASLLVEHFLTSAVVTSFRPLLLTGFENKKNLLSEVDPNTHDMPNLKYSVGQSRIAPEERKVGNKKVVIMPSFEIYFDNFMVFTSENLNTIKDSFNARTSTFDEIPYVRKEMEVDSRTLKQNISALVTSGRLEKGFFVDEVHTYRRMMNDIIDNVKDRLVDKKGKLRPVEELEKNICFNYALAIFIGTGEDVTLDTVSEYKPIAQKFAEALDLLLFAPKNSFIYSKAVPPNSKLIKVSAPQELAGDDYSDIYATPVSIGKGYSDEF